VATTGTEDGHKQDT